MALRLGVALRRRCRVPPGFMRCDAGFLETAERRSPDRFVENQGIVGNRDLDRALNVEMARYRGYEMFSLTNPWKAACNNDGENGRLQNTLMPGSCFESVRKRGNADGCRFL